MPILSQIAITLSKKALAEFRTSYPEEINNEWLADWDVHLERNGYVLLYSYCVSWGPDYDETKPVLDFLKRLSFEGRDDEYHILECIDHTSTIMSGDAGHVFEVGIRKVIDFPELNLRPGLRFH